LLFAAPREQVRFVVGAIVIDHDNVKAGLNQQ
jgi:hypothetical protein